VNITKGNYILYINTQASQASGVGGRAVCRNCYGAPSADAVIKEWPSQPCGSLEKSPVYTNKDENPFTEWILYVNNQEKNLYCNVPANNSTVWVLLLCH